MFAALSLTAEIADSIQDASSDRRCNIVIRIAMQELPCLAPSPQAYRRNDRGHAEQRPARTKDRPGPVRDWAGARPIATLTMLVLG